MPDGPLPVWQRVASDIQTQRLSAAELWSGTRRIRFRPKEQHRAKGLSAPQLVEEEKGEKPGGVA